ncbi:uncharacterized protein LOC118406518 [Branchiostoma floridae]|uniref:Uncharacterized protein LOC118406518 n=1 Tax=Branchiostoma floridae TaxID=7739 RepID=A0A9J7KJX4_BRAFL|nr:uncharacterized protein LOC118406518 [Branchiostoma floridae]
MPGDLISTSEPPLAGVSSTAVGFMADDLASNAVLSASAAAGDSTICNVNMFRASQNVGNMKSICRPSSDGGVNPCIQPYAVGYLDYEDDSCYKEKRGDNPCVQAYAVEYQDDDDDDDDKDWFDDKPTKRNDNPCIQQYAIGYKDVDNNDEKPTRRDDNPGHKEKRGDNLYIQPYAVGYQDDDDDDDYEEKPPELDTEDPCIQPYAIGYKDDSGYKEKRGDNPCIQPYAVGYQDDDTFYFDKPTKREDNPCIQPYATGYQDYDDGECVEKSKKSDAAAVNEQASLPMHIDIDTRSPIYSQDAENNSSINQQYDVTTNPIFPLIVGKPNPIYPQNTEQSSSIYQQNIGNSNLTDDSNTAPKLTRTADCDDNPCIQPYAVGYQEEDDDGNKQPKRDHENPCIQPYAVGYQGENDDDGNKHPKHDYNPCFQPYAVRYQEDNDDSKKHPKPGPAALHVDIQPYAVAYMCQEDVSVVVSSSDVTQTKQPFQKVETFSKSSNDIPNNVAGPGISKDTTGALRSLKKRHALVMNPMYGQHALNPNPMANVQQQTACGCRYVRLAAVLITTIVLSSVLISGMVFGILYSSQDIQTKPFANESFWTTTQPSISISSKEIYNGNMKWETTRKTTQSVTFHSSQETYDGNMKWETTQTVTFHSSQGAYTRKWEKIIFGGIGQDRGKFMFIYGVAVSPDNEIFVTDSGNKRVQVFNMDGAFLRLFPTVVPGDSGKKTMNPSDVAIDGDGNLWVTLSEKIGLYDDNTHTVCVVQYDWNGTALSTFETQPSEWLPMIDVFILTS